MRLFVEDDEATDAFPATPMPDTSAPLAIGVQSDPGSYGDFDGLVDELAVYDKALSPEQVSRHRAAGR